MLPRLERQRNIGRRGLPEEKLTEETTSGISTHVGKLEVKLTNCQKLSVDKGSTYPLSTSRINFQEFDEILKVNTGQKSSYVSGWERAEGTILKYTGAFYSS